MLCVCVRVCPNSITPRPVILNLDSSTLLWQQQGFVIVPHYPINNMCACGQRRTQTRTHSHTGLDFLECVLAFVCTCTRVQTCVLRQSRN